MPLHKAKTLLLTLLMVIVLTASTYAQREADRWYFGFHCGLNFNSGEPEVLYDGCADEPFGGVGTISDSICNLLFYSTGDTVYTSQHTYMENGFQFDGSGAGGGTQNNLIVQWPESDSLYFLFKIPNLGDGMGLSYNIININRNNGLGTVVEKDILLNHAWDAADKVTATLHKNKRDIWVIARKFRDDSYAVFLITPEGIDEIPTLYTAPDLAGANTDCGVFKFSFDKKYLFANYYMPKTTEVCRFNDATGEVEFLYDLNIGTYVHGLEFSPDSKFAYIYYQQGSVPGVIKQYKMEHVEDVSLFITTSVDVGNNLGYGLQLATDGKIYCIDNVAGGTTTEYFVGTIHKPWELGTDCQFEEQAINMYPGETSHSIPNIFMDYLYRFEFEGVCAGVPFLFTSNFNPVPDSIRWLFNDPASGINNVSNEVNPLHIFPVGGIFEVEVDVWYPSGRFEHTSREVEVAHAPSPDLGPDELICEGDTLVLNAGSEPGMYLWSTNAFGQNIFSSAVSDTGTHWVQVTNANGCTTADSIHVGWFGKAVFNEDNLMVSPTSCGENNGSITGISIDGVVSISTIWYDGNGNFVGNTLDIDSLSVGNYFLHVTDANNCITISRPYTITDAGDILITAVGALPAHCLQQIGSISISASSGAGNDFLYSILNGAVGSWQSDSLFPNLLPGEYFVRVKDLSGCETVYENNPVVVENIEGPQVTSVGVNDENDYLADGSINIQASVTIGSIEYSIDSGNYFQINDGLFENLSAGTYHCVVKDGFGCDTTFTVEIDRISSQLIYASAGDGYACIGNAVASPLLLSDFMDVHSFHVMLTYEKDLITCTEYMQAHPDLADSLQVSTTSSGEVHISWQGESPVSLPDSSLMLKLVFRGVDEGLSPVDWVAEQGESQFFNGHMELINTYYEQGAIIIYSRPEIMHMPPTKAVCEGKHLWVTPSVSGGTGVAQTQWTGPDNYTGNYGDLFFDEVTSDMAGTYTLIVTDTLQCADTASVDVVVNQAPEIAFAPHDTIWAEPGFILDAGHGAESYVWNTGEITETIVIDSIGSYNVEVTSHESCISTDTVQILWGGNPFYLPNAFTPNGDGLNDVFGAIRKYDHVNQFLMSIYNRWGQMIFETTDINKGWNGTFKGSPCMMGAYIYRIVYEEFGQQPTGSKIVEGTVMLVR